jgi:ADP-heptose:LPS heptosyltransferase
MARIEYWLRLTWSGRGVLGGRANDHRNIPLRDFVALLPPNGQLVSLQREVSDEDRQLLAIRTDIQHFDEQLQDFSDTAALCELVDMVVSIDTSVAHLAGAMGKPLWILLPFNADWRWLLHREDSPWYPSARLFRQPALGDWASVIGKVQAEFRREFC